jgi:hypothetical protein
MATKMRRKEPVTEPPDVDVPRGLSAEIVALFEEVLRRVTGEVWPELRGERGEFGRLVTRLTDALRTASNTSKGPDVSLPWSQAVVTLGVIDELGPKNYVSTEDDNIFDYEGSPIDTANYLAQRLAAAMRPALKVGDRVVAKDNDSSEEVVITGMWLTPYGWEVSVEAPSRGCPTGLALSHKLTRADERSSEAPS